MSSLTSDRMQIAAFMSSIYPNGITLSELVENAVKFYGISQDKAHDMVQKMLTDEEQKSKTITIVNAEDKRTKKMETYIKLTDIGKKTVWTYINLLYKEKPNIAFKKVKKWVEIEDKLAKDSYYQILSNEMLINFDVYSAMTTPRPKSEILESTLLLRGIDMNNKKRNDHVAQIMKTIARGSTIGLIDILTREYSYIEMNGEQKTRSENFYVLTEDGQKGVQILNYNFKNKNLAATRHQPVKGEINKEVLQNLFDLPWQKIIILVIIAFFISIFLLSVIMPAFNQQLYESVEGGYQLADISFLGYAIFGSILSLIILSLLASSSEIIGRIKILGEKRSKK